MTQFELPTALAEFICVGEVERGDFVANGLFNKKFGTPPPDFGRHIIAFYRDQNMDCHVASYLHLWTREKMGFIGGGCTDGAVMAKMSSAEKEAVNATGGLLRQTLLYTFNELKGGLDAFFGHCGNARAKEVDLAAGFLETDDKHLLVYWTGELTHDRQQSLIGEALSIGRF